MATVYNLTAINCVAPIAPSLQTALNPQGGAPTLSPAYGTGDDSISARLNENGRRTDLTGRTGGGSYGIFKGLALSQTVAGKVDVAAGQAMLDGTVHVAATLQGTLTVAQKNWVFLRQNKSLSVVAAATFPAPPASVVCYLGMVDVDGAGLFTDVDLSGVFFLWGGVGMRRTADTGAPGDTPPAGYAFLTRAASTDLFWWDGGQYWKITTSGGITLADGANIAVGTGTGTKIGTATTQKLGFFNATPIVQPANTTDLRAALINLGFLAAGGATPLDLNGGALTCLAVTSSLGTGAGTMTNLGRANVQTSAAGVGNGADATDDVLFTYSLPLNSLSGNGKSVRVRAAGTLAANGQNKRVKLWFAGTALVDSGVVAYSAKNWSAEVEVTRIDATHVSCIGTITFDTGAAAIVTSTPNLVVADLTANASVVQATGASPTSSSAGDVLGTLFRVDFGN